MTKYDDASWHFGGDFPSDLKINNARTHIGMFLGWVVDNKLYGNLLEEIHGENLRKFKDRKISPSQLFKVCCDDKLTNEDLNEEGNSFALHYYETDIYLEDYEEILGKDIDTLYHAEDSWENYLKISKRITKRYTEWLKEMHQVQTHKNK